MTAEWIPIMRKTRRLKLDFSNTFFHYAPCITLLFVSGLLFYDYVKRQQGLDIALVFVSIAIIFLFIQNRALSFIVIEVSNNENDFREAVRRTAKELQANIENCNSQFARINRGWNWESSLGERITIIRNNNSIMFNSITHPRASAISSFGWNKKNSKIFFQNLNDVINGVPEKEIEIILEKEWTLKKIIIRIFLYPLAFTLIGLSIWMLVTTNNFLIPVTVIVISGYYLYADLKIILDKNTNSNSRI